MATQNAELTDAQLEQALRVLQRAGVVQVNAAAARKAAPRLGVKVVVNEGAEAQKYGDITIGKETELGGFLPKIGLRVDQVEPVIKLLRAAKKEATQG